MDRTVTSIETEALDAIRWDGTNTEAVEAFAGCRCVDSATVLLVRADGPEAGASDGADDDRAGLLGHEPLHVVRDGWLVRADGVLRALPPEATDALVSLTVALPGPAVGDTAAGDVAAGEPRGRGR